MQAIIRLWSRQIVEECRQSLADWQAEHECYYGATHGTVWVGPAMVVPGPEMIADAYGFQPVGNGGRWLTSGGNYTAVWFDHEAVVIAVAGRRHGIRWPFATDDLQLDPLCPARIVVDDEHGGLRCVGEIEAYNSLRTDESPWAVGLEACKPATV